jgi:hypothetical protein
MSEIQDNQKNPGVVLVAEFVMIARQRVFKRVRNELTSDTRRFHTEQDVRDGVQDYDELLRIEVRDMARELLDPNGELPRLIIGE